MARRKHTAKKLKMTEKDFMLANRRAARLEEIAAHGKPISFRSIRFRSKKAYSRKKLKPIDEGD